MKKTILAIVILIGITATVNAQTTIKKEVKETPKMELKDHACTTACEDGQHLYAHGEKGHVCTAGCMTATVSSEKMELKDHVCTTACAEGQHVYAHGEKGHVCTEACKK